MSAQPTPSAEKRYRNFIGGEWVASESPRATPNVNPADTREVLGQIPLSSAEEARRAAAAAQAAYAGWRATPAPRRGAVLFRAMAIMDAEKEDLARLLTREEGKTVKESLGEIQRSINILEYIAAEGRRIGGQTIPSELPSNFCYTVRQPLGVVVCVTPWNFPVAIPVWKIAPALVSGNTVVFKPATLTPETASAVVSIFERAGLPKGVLNLVLGSGASRQSALVTTMTSRPSPSRAATRWARRSTPAARSAWRGCSARWAARTRSWCSLTRTSTSRSRRAPRAPSDPPASAARRRRA